jgi:PAS domain-containing protein
MLIVFVNRVLRRIFGPKREEVIREWKKLLNEDLSDLYCSPDIVCMVKLIRMKWAWYVARLGEMCIEGFGEET